MAIYVVSFKESDILDFKSLKTSIVLILNTIFILITHKLLLYLSNYKRNKYKYFIDPLIKNQNLFDIENI